MPLEHNTVGDGLVDNADLNRHLKFIGMGGDGRSMLDKLNSDQHRELMVWWDANPNADGMDWPGWAQLVLDKLKD